MCIPTQVMYGHLVPHSNSSFSPSTSFLSSYTPFFKLRSSRRRHLFPRAHCPRYVSGRSFRNTNLVFRSILIFCHSFFVPLARLGSTPNRSEKPRASFINRYLAADDYQLVFATSVAMRAEGEARARADERAVKSEKQRGFMVRGRRPFDPDFDYDAGSGVHH